MTLPRLFLLISLFLFGAIGVLALSKNKKKQQYPQEGIEKVSSSLIDSTKNDRCKKDGIQEKVDLSLLQSSPKNSLKDTVKTSVRSIGSDELGTVRVDSPADREAEEGSVQNDVQKVTSVIIEHDDEPEALSQLFVKGTGCPIVETVRYSSRVSWKPKKQAWLVDYANYYKTPVDFIVHYITGRSGGEAPPIKEGQQFTVLRNDRSFYFHVIVSFASMKMRLYYVMPQENKAVFLKSYPVCLGRKDPSKSSGSLTPFGVFLLGQRVACFKPKMMGTHKGHRVELVQVFGTRWIPFEKEVFSCTEPAKGFGIHGAPFVREGSESSPVEDSSSISTWASDGCIRLKQRDIEELFSVISTRTSYVEIIPDFRESSLLKGQLLQSQ